MLKILVALIVLALGLSACAFAEEASQAETVMNQLRDGDFETLFENSTDALKTGVGSSDNLAATWGQITMMLGGYVGYTDIAETEIPDMTSYSVSCDFEKATATIVIAFDADNKLGALQVTGYNFKLEEDAEGGYIEEDIILRAGEPDETKGMLTLPESEGQYPVVIMLHGSGASDMNETSFGLAIFRDIAHMLARKGVASVRYDKYPYAHAEMCMTPDFTVDTEYGLDITAALGIISGDARLTDIYLMGHSEGAMVAPRMIRDFGEGKIAGALLIEGTPMSLSDILVRQLKDMGQDTSVYEKAFSDMMTMTEDELKSNVQFGTSLYYWKDIADSDVAQIILDMNIPVFISQGMKDYQVLPEEGVLAWKQALGDYADADYHEYPDMNHLLFDMEGEMTASTDDYKVLGDISQTLVDDMAKWILER